MLIIEIYIFFVSEYVSSLIISSYEFVPVAEWVSAMRLLNSTRWKRKRKKSRGGKKEGAEETRESALSRSPGVTRKSLVRHLSRQAFGSKGWGGEGSRCILICTLTDSFPILIYKQITPLFKFLHGNSLRRSFYRFRGLSLIPRVSPR